MKWAGEKAGLMGLGLSSSDRRGFSSSPRSQSPSLVVSKCEQLPRHTTRATVARLFSNLTQ